MHNATHNRKDLWTQFLLSFLLLCAAGVFAVTGDAPQTFVLTALGLGVSAIVRRPLERNTRTFVYAGVTALIVTVLSDMVLPVDGDRFFLMPAHLYCPAVVYLGVAATFLDQRDTNLSAIIALSLVGTMLAGNTLSTTAYKTGFPLGSLLLAHFHPFYGAVVAAQLLTMLAVLPKVDRRRTHRAPSHPDKWRRYAILTAAIVAAVVATIGLRQVAFCYERVMQHAFTRVCRLYFMRRPDRVVFGDSVDLWCTVPYRSRAEKTIVLRAKSHLPPGYLRGRVFTRYVKGRWVDLMAGDSLLGRQTGTRYAYTMFQRPSVTSADMRSPATASRNTIDLFLDPSAYSDVLFAPGHAQQIELVARGLTDNADGVLAPRDWDRRAGYTVHLNSHVLESAFPSPLPGGGKMAPYLGVPASIREDLARVTRSVFLAGEDASPRAEVRQLLRFFRQNFTYALGVDMHADTQDPVIQFLEKHRKGHCELFAAATVLLLRTRNIPARYVTGFLCHEPHPARTHWVARLEDAHAWAEAYLTDERRWVRIDATPGDGIPPATSDFGVLQAQLDRLRLFWQDLLAKVKRGYVAEAIAVLFIALGRTAWVVVNHPVRGPVVIIALFVGLRHLVHRRRQRKRAEEADMPESRYQLLRLLRRVEGYVHKRLGIQREPHETLRELGKKVSPVADKNAVDIILELLREYEELRYQLRPPTSDVVSRFAEKVKRQLARMDEPAA